MSRPPRIPNRLPSNQRTVYFKTFCVEGRKQVLNNAATWNVCLSTLQKLDRWQVLAAVAMPDHLHILVSPHQRESSVTAFAKWFKRWFNEGFAVATGRDIAWGWAGRMFRSLAQIERIRCTKMGVFAPKSRPRRVGYRRR